MSSLLAAIVPFCCFTWRAGPVMAPVEVITGAITGPARRNPENRTASALVLFSQTCFNSPPVSGEPGRIRFRTRPGTAGKRHIMVRGLRWTLTAFIVFLVGVLPIVYYRADYSHSKRLRAIVPGKLYRSGQMTAEGFRDAITDLDIRTVVNLQEDYPDPDLKESYFDSSRIKET